MHDTQITEVLNMPDHKHTSPSQNRSRTETSLP